MSTDTEQAASSRLGWQTWDRLKQSEWFVALASIVFVLAFPWVFTESPVISGAISGYMSLGKTILLWSIFGIGFKLLLAETGLLSFGHAMFWGLGAYMAAWVSRFFVPFPIVMVLGAVLVSIVLAALVALILLRLHTVYFAIVSLAIAQMIYWTAITPAYALTGGINGLTQFEVGKLLGMFDLAARLPEGIRVLIPDYMYLVIAVAFVLTVVVINRVLKSPYGLIFQGIRENETRTSTIGLSTWRYKFAAFVMSAAVTGFAGGLGTLHNEFVGVRQLLWTASGDIVVITVLGGLGSLAGPVLGALVYRWFGGVVTTFETIGPLWQLMLAVVFTAVVWRFPGGIWGMFQSITGFVRRRTESSPEEPAAEPEGGDD